MKNTISAACLSIFLLVLPVLITNAQDKTPSPVHPRVSLGAEFAVPVGKQYSDSFTIGFGGSGKLDVPITSALYATASAGFVSFYSKDKNAGVALDLNNKSYIPLKAGAKYYMSPIFYAQGEVGASVGIQKNSGTSLIWAPGLGASFPITKRGFFNSDIRFEGWMREGGNLNHLALRVGYQF